LSKTKRFSQKNVNKFAQKFFDRGWHGGSYTKIFTAEYFISWRKFKESSLADNVHGLNEPQTKWSDHRSSEKKQLLV